MGTGYCSYHIFTSCWEKTPNNIVCITYLAIGSIHLEDDVADRIQDLTVILGDHLQDNFKLDFKFRKKDLVTVESEGRQMNKYWIKYM